jgi:hypothetical protein
MAIGDENFSGRWWDKRAYKLQLSVKCSDEFDSVREYKNSEVNQAIVRNRLDTVRVVSLLSSLNKQARSIKRILWVIALLMALPIVFYTIFGTLLGALTQNIWMW